MGALSKVIKGHDKKIRAANLHPHNKTGKQDKVLYMNLQLSSSQYMFAKHIPVHCTRVIHVQLKYMPYLYIPSNYCEVG